MSRGNKTHGHYGSLTHKNWAEMLYRCRKEGKKYYKDKGITVCVSWEKFENFLKDMGERPTPKHSIDRLDVKGNYCKENCRWATMKQQQRNRGNNRLIKGKTLSEWSEILGVKRSTLAQRYYVYGWSVECTLSKIK
jgi:hypothetical protein